MSEQEFFYETLENVQYPTVPIILHSSDQAMPTQALVDSGANYCLFRDEVAAMLNIEIEAGQKMEITGIGGKISTYLHEIKIQLFDRKIKCRVAFSKEFRFKVNVLGRAGFFDAHEITFREREKKIKVKELD